MSKLKMWNEKEEWEARVSQWEEGAKAAAVEKPIKGLKTMPGMVGITKETARFLKIKSLKWMIKEDRDHTIKKEFFRHPFLYSWRYLKSVFQRKSYRREGDFFYYGIRGAAEFESQIKNPKNLFVVGFSYCHKPFECPSGRFTDQCIHDPNDLVCRQCFIGKAMNLLPEGEVIPLVIPTIHYIAGQLIDLKNRYPGHKLVFLITACEMTLEMFGDWGNMAGVTGIGIRLDGRICNTMRAFELSEKGIKPGLTVVLPEAQEKVLHWLRVRKASASY